jgi:hypothetical protein
MLLAVLLIVGSVGCTQTLKFQPVDAVSREPLGAVSVDILESRRSFPGWKWARSHVKVNSGPPLSVQVRRSKAYIFTFRKSGFMDAEFHWSEQREALLAEFPGPEGQREPRDKTLPPGLEIVPLSRLP